ncbi:hemagglutinin repeat-containing protein [Bartonella harrusi]|uniref:Hemagglutinin repeat-containing protein n=1 Tax=Bartonella harrusi TaxID=2961895 RepID=A0ABY5EX30_9HYPH|nr:hemagglutinin repeat-containing protein [Bartonella harrusi]UTO28998.1 hemagglutinin repeat-containing protein [Bartonella harrusi]
MNANLNSTQSASVNVGYSYGTGGAGGTGNASFGKGKGSSKELQQKNSHVIGTGTVHTASGANTTLAGAVVSGNQVKVDVGESLTITSRSDSGQTSNKQKSISVGFGGSKSFDAGSTSLSLQKDQSSSDYSSVIEQSGIKAGDGGFDINVKDNTTLTGGLISSSAPAENNSLITGSITATDITNSAHAKASSHGVSVSGGGLLQQGTSGILKNLAKNALGHGKAKDAAEGETKSAISEGTIILTGATNQRAMGQDAGQIIDALNRNTAAAHQAVGQLNVAPLEDILRNRLGMKNQWVDEWFDYWDKVREIAFIKKHPVGEVEHAENGNVLYLKDKNGEYIKDSNGKYITLYHYLKPEEEQHLQAGSDGIRRMFYNGIYNTPDDAARNAVQLADNKNEPLYFTYFPQAEDKLVEFGVAFYQKFWEGDTWGLSNSTKKFQNFVRQYGNKGAIVSAHSRGTLTVSNRVNNFKKHGVHGVAKKTDFYLFGAAAHNQSIANTVDEISYGKKNYVYTQGHLLDPISTVVGYNWPTAYKVPNLYLLPAIPTIEQGKALLGYDPSTHRCYGDASRECKTNYGSFPFKKTHSTRTGNKK